MGAPISISFLIDEHLPVWNIRPLLEAHGHRVEPVRVGVEDQNIIGMAERIGAIVITADKWFLEELFRYPPGHRNCFQRAGVIQVPGTWAAARLRLTTYLPVIEVLARVRSAQPDCRLAIDLSRRVIRIPEP
jgi:hypothetical protein